MDNAILHSVQILIEPTFSSIFWKDLARWCRKSLVRYLLAALVFTLVSAWQRSVNGDKSIPDLPGAYVSLFVALTLVGFSFQVVSSWLKSRSPRYLKENQLTLEVFREGLRVKRGESNSFEPRRWNWIKNVVEEEDRFLLRLAEFPFSWFPLSKAEVLPTPEKQASFREWVTQRVEYR